MVTWGKRIFLFLAVNMLVMLTVNILLNIFNVQPYLQGSGLNYQSLMAFCFIWGMGGAFVSLLISKMMAKWMMGVKIINPQSNDADHRQLVSTVYRLARAAGIATMPEVGIYESPEINAFATGPSRNNSLVAVSSGLLGRMSQAQIEGVLGHEIAHVANGDMVTMTLIQGVVNAFVMFLSRVIAFAIMQAMRGKDDERERSGVGNSFAYFGVQMALEIIFMILGSMVVAWFSRWREFRADQGGAKFAGKQKMIDALMALKSTVDEIESRGPQQGIQTLKISGRGGFLKLFSTHPPLEDRILALESSVI